LSIKNSVSKAPSVSDITVGISPSFRRNRRHKGSRLDDFDELLTDDAEVFAFVTAEGSGDIFPQSKTGVFSICCCPHFLDNSHGLHKQTAAGGLPVSIGFVLEACPFSCHRQILAGGAEGDDVHRLDLGTVHLADVAEVSHIWEPAPGDRYGVGFHLCRPDGLDATEATGQREATGSVE
jgi:hypothetical protein